MLSDVDFLKQVTILRDVPVEQLVGLAQGLHHRHYADGEVIFHQGDPSLAMFIVASGEVKVTEKRLTQGDVHLATLGPHGVLGEIGVLDGSSRSANATAVGETELLMLPRHDILDLIDREPTVVRSILLAVLEIIRRSNQRIFEVTSLGVPARLALAFLTLAQGHGRKVDEGILIDRDVTRSDLAEMTALNVSSIEHPLRDMEYDDILRVDGQRYIIRRPETLREWLPPGAYDERFADLAAGA